MTKRKPIRKNRSISISPMITLRGALNEQAAIKKDMGNSINFAARDFIIASLAIKAIAELKIRH
ncbi:MAG: hypothetical protein KDE54_36385 [Caldilineaceae bacterium]|nr:hypothetical protein [Caldilineaceae bacterium]